MQYVILIFSLFFTFQVFSQVESLDIKNALKEPREVKLSEIASDVFFVELDYVGELENDNNVFCYLLKDKIVCVGKSIYIFDRKGKLQDLLRIPRDELFSLYLEFRKISLLDEKRRTLIIPMDNEYAQQYNIDKMPSYQLLIRPTKLWNVDRFVGHLPTGYFLYKGINFEGKSSSEYYICSGNRILYETVNTDMFNCDRTTLDLRDGSYFYSNQLFFYADGEDFIYEIKDRTKQKVYALGCSDLKLNYPDYLKAVRHYSRTGSRMLMDIVLRKHISSLFLTECKSSILFSFLYANQQYIGYYSKKNKQTIIGKPSKEKCSCFIDDIKRKHPFSCSRSNINENNELISFLPVEESFVVREEERFSIKSLFPFFFGEIKHGRVVSIMRLK